MDRKARRIFITAALGTMAGLYVSISFLPSLVWWLGALIGGVGAGAVYALPDIIRSLPIAYQAAKNDLARTGGTLSAVLGSMRRMPVQEKWGWLAGAIFILICLSWVMFGLIFVERFGYVDNKTPTFTRLYWIIGMPYLVFAEVILIWSFRALNYPFRHRTAVSEAEAIKKIQKGILLITPPGFLFLLIFLSVKVTVAAVQITPLAGRLILIGLEGLLSALITFVKTLFFLVHSKELVLCMIDAAIGVLVSYPLTITMNLQIGPALLSGGLIGGMIGILHYEIVSIRILRLPR